jgi:hypothetical protein
MQSLKPSAGVNAEKSKGLWNCIYDETPGLAWPGQGSVDIFAAAPRWFRPHIENMWRSNA